MADQDNEIDETQVNVAPGVVLRADQMSFTRSADPNPFANLVHGRQPGKLGDILMKMGRITLEQLQRGVATQEKHPGKKLGEVLVDMGFTNQQAVEQALRRQESERQPAAEPAAQPARRPGTGQLAPRLPRRVPRWKTENEVRRWDRRLDA